MSVNVWRKSVFDIFFTEFGATLSTVLPVLFRYCYKYCYSDSRKRWAVMKGGGLTLQNLFQPTISLEMPVPSQGHYDFQNFPVVDWFCLFIYFIEFWLSLCKIVRSSVILLLPLFMCMLCISLFVLLAIVLSVLPRFTDSDYPFGIFKFFLN